MKICVLQPDYSQSEVDYKKYDPPRDLARLYPEAQVDHVFLNKRSTYSQLKALRNQGYDVFVNLCEAYLEWDVPSLDVIHALDLLDLPYTGPTAQLYDPSKPLMKYVAHTAGVATPDFAIVRGLEDIDRACAHLHFPLFVKPYKAGDSLGVNAQSLAHDAEALRAKIAELLHDFDEALVESYIPGREFTVLVAADPDGGAAHAYRPLEFVFPEGQFFKTYDLKITQWHPECNLPCPNGPLERQLRAAALRIFKTFEGVGYARLDFRVDAAGRLFFLEINFACSVFYAEGHEGSADYILKHDGAGQAGFLRRIVAEGIARWQRKQKCYEVRGNSIAGFGIHAVRDIAEGEIVFRGEERLQRIVTRAWVEANWRVEDKVIFSQYAYPISDEVYILWDSNPDEWAPQNHCCTPNTAYSGLNLLALRHIHVGEELTLDYATILDEQAAPFACRCGSPQCRGHVGGTPFNSVTAREKNVREGETFSSV